MFLSWMKGASGAEVEKQVSSTDPLPTQEGPMTTADAAISPSNTVTVAVGRLFHVFCSVAGNVKVGFADGTSVTFAVPTGTTLLPWAVNQVFVTGTTATATYNNLR